MSRPAAQAPDACGRWPLAAPIDLRWTLFGGHGPHERPVALHGDPVSEGSWRAGRFDTGPAAVRMRVRGAELLADAWGEGAHEALARVPAWAGLADHWTMAPPGSAVDPRASAGLVWPPRLQALRRQRPGLRLGARRPLSEVLVPIIIAQRVTHEEAVRGYLLVTRRCGAPAPGPNPALWLPPTPRAIAATPGHTYRHDGIEASRARTLREVALASRAIDALPASAPRGAFDALRSIRGVGPWTAAIAVARAFGWADAVPLNDYDLANAVAWNLAGERRATDQRMLELLEPFRGSRWRVVQLLVACGAFPPRRTPRYRGRGFAGIHRPPREQ